MNKTKLVKNGLIYTIASVMAQAISMFLLPVFTRNLTQAEFGTYSLMITVQALLNSSISLGVVSGYTRFYNEYQDKKQLKNTALAFVLASGTIFTVVMTLISVPLYTLIFGPSSTATEQVLVVMLSTVALAVISLYLACFIMQHKAFKNSLINISKSLLVLTISSILIIVFKWGVLGALYGQLFAYVIIAIVLLISDHKQISLKYSPNLLKPMVKYGAGLIPGHISSWVYSLIDRYFIRVMIGLNMVAVYSAGYRMGMLMEPVFLVPFKSVFTAFIYREYNSDDAPKKIRAFYNYYVSAGWFIVLGMSVFSKMAVLILLTEDYMSAAYVVPWIVFSYYIHGLGEFYSVGIHIAQKTNIRSVILFLCAIFNVVVNIILIPPYGMYGAVAATVISYLLLNAIQFFVGKKYYDTHLRYAEALYNLPVVVTFYLVYLALDSQVNSIIGLVGIPAIICIAYLILGYFFRYIPREMFDYVINIINAKLNRTQVQRRSAVKEYTINHRRCRPLSKRRHHLL